MPDENALRVLEDALYCHVAMCDGPEPYVIPMGFGCDGDTLYFHTGRKGRKLDLVRRNPRVAFAAETGVSLRPAGEPCKYGMNYRGVAGKGTMEIVEDPAEIVRALDIIMKHYGWTGPDGEYSEHALSRTVILKMRIDEISFKSSGQSE